MYTGDVHETASKRGTDGDDNEGPYATLLKPTTLNKPWLPVPVYMPKLCPRIVRAAPPCVVNVDVGTLTTLVMFGLRYLVVSTDMAE